MTIPKVIHQIWIGNQNKRPSKMMQTWIDKNPSWEYMLWSEDNIPTLINKQHFRNMREYSGKADILRYELLLNYGGFYIDADSVCLKPLEDWLCDNDSFACYENEILRGELIANGYLAATKNNELMGLLVEELKQIKNINEYRAWIVSGPVLLTNTYRKYTYEKLKIYPSHYFIPQHHSYTERYDGSDYVFAEQYWGNTQSLYGILK
jgi:mannosyltransferase OCH1-like enzyme